MTSSSAPRLHPACQSPAFANRGWPGERLEKEEARWDYRLTANTGTRRERQEAAMYTLKPVALLFMPPSRYSQRQGPCPKQKYQAPGLWVTSSKPPSPDT